MSRSERPRCPEWRWPGWAGWPERWDQYKTQRHLSVAKVWFQNKFYKKVGLLGKGARKWGEEQF